MTRRPLTTFQVLLLLSFSLTGCNTGNPPDSESVRTSQHDKPVAVQNADAHRAKPVLVRGDGYIGVIFPADSKELPGLYPRSASYWTPSESDVLVAEKGLIPFLEKSKNPNAPEILKRIGTYKRQYRGIILDGHKQIFIRFFCETFSENWMSEEEVVNDGGSCFFDLRFSTETETFSHLWVNGEA
jgi:hypothetical protein